MIALTQKAIAILDELHDRMDRAERDSPSREEIFDTIGTVIAMLRDGFDPDENL